MIKNCKMISFKNHTDGRGNLIAIEYPSNLEFPVNRIYYIYGVGSDIERGFHSHQNLEQVLIAVNGSIKVKVLIPDHEEIVELNDPTKGLYIGPMVWREMFDFSDSAVLLVLASKKYDENDYIRDKEEYLELAKEYFGDKNE